MGNILANITEIILLLFLTITFLQSGIDKILDWNGNVSWLKGHFKDTFLGKMVPLSVGIILVIEVISGICTLIGCYELAFTENNTIALTGTILSCVTLLMLLFGQRLAKDYEGAKTIAVYFVPAIFLLFLLSN
ncbi:DoxX family protein [Aurantibacter sp.]|uniref:DoxX family protein n=1 Tax=Aurantibacter sp. TaxID=2807103 RepID=UPI0035C83F58